MFEVIEGSIAWDILQIFPNATEEQIDRMVSYFVRNMEEGMKAIIKDLR